ncbi:MAG TPA: hypothetical protein DHV48_03655 [Prolixibacteraceae bacterium]|nr:hypothetical protein [Prolixibacteraceae bacterium]
MKTTDFAIDEIYRLISGSAIETPVYKLTKPSKKKDAEYIVLNTLPISAGVLQKCYVNVNYHVKDLSPGMADMVTLQEGTNALMALLEDVPAIGIIIDFEMQEYHRESQLEEHYSNIRLSVKIINT